MLDEKELNKTATLLTVLEIVKWFLLGFFGAIVLVMVVAV